MEFRMRKYLFAALPLLFATSVEASVLPQHQPSGAAEVAGTHVAYRNCWWRGGTRHCAYRNSRTHGYRASGNRTYYPRDASQLRTGSRRWWDQKESEGSAGRP